MKNSEATTILFVAQYHVKLRHGVSRTAKGHHTINNTRNNLKRVYGADGAGNIHTVHTTTQRLSRPPPIQKLGAENHTLQLNI